VTIKYRVNFLTQQHRYTFRLHCSNICRKDRSRRYVTHLSPGSQKGNKNIFLQASKFDSTFSVTNKLNKRAFFLTICNYQNITQKMTMFMDA